jgi:Zn-dependent peptidase ImmA (M78 family)
MNNKTLEDEANLFAMLLLMPKKFIEEDLKNGIDLTDDKALKVLARKYEVPVTAMAIRIGIYIKKKI